MLKIILAESALETIPKELLNNPAIKRYFKKNKKNPFFTLLDRSYHHKAMKKISNNEKRGRPDIVHLCLLAALGSPLNKEGLLRIYVHTYNNKLIYVNPETKIPKNFSRFRGLMEQLFELKRVPQTGKPLLILKQKKISDLITTLKPSHTLIFSKDGKPMTLEESLQDISKPKELVVIVGGFPSGNFTPKTLSLADDIVSVDQETLEAWTVLSRFIYEYERIIGIPKKRI
jgi:rRNA small subunit pseudouridine methyltransferase Nep1